MISSSYRYRVWLLVVAFFIGNATLASSVLALEVVSPGINLLDNATSVRTDASLFWVQPKTKGNSSFTVRTILNPDATVLESATSLWLAGLSGAPGSVEPTFGLTWFKDTSGWWDQWKIGLVRPAAGGTNSTPITVAEVAPQSGHRYEAWLSFSAPTGVTAVRVTDLTSGQLICAAAYRLASANTQFYPTAGISLAPGKRLPTVPSIVEAFNVYPEYMPVSFTWEVQAKNPSADSFTPVWKLEVGDTAQLFVKNPVPVEGGAFRFSIENSLGNRTIGTSSGLLNTDTIPLAEALPMGQSEVNVEYVVDNRVLLRDSLPLTLGSATVSFAAVNANRSTGNLEGSIRVNTPYNVSSVQIQVPAHIYRMVWDEAEKAYRYELQQKTEAFAGTLQFSTTGSVDSQNEAVAPLKVELPQEPGLWKVAFGAELTPALGINITGAERLFSTYTPAKTTPGQPYIIAVLPDTQYHTRNYPDILTRQAQWIAQNAQSKNIAFMLHVGDITDNNTPLHWERAHDRITILNGVVPYALAVGNHDIGKEGAECRDETLIDQYFKTTDFGNLRGTYAPGREANSFHTFTAAGQKYLVMVLEFGPRNDVLAWANDVVTAHPDHKVIIITHTYTSRSGSRVSGATSGGTPELVLPIEAKDVNNAVDMWDKFVRKHANIFLVLSGHIGANTIPYSIGIGDKGNRVYEFLLDYQNEPHGGDGWLALLQFNPDGNIEVQAYSPYLGTFKSDKDKYGFTNNMTINTQRGWVYVH